MNENRWPSAGPVERTDRGTHLAPPPPGYGSGRGPAAPPPSGNETWRALLWLTVGLVGVGAVVWFVSTEHSSTPVRASNSSSTPLTYGLPAGPTSDAGATPDDEAAPTSVQGGAPTVADGTSVASDDGTGSGASLPSLSGTVPVQVGAPRAVPPPAVAVPPAPVAPAPVASVPAAPAPVAPVPVAPAPAARPLTSDDLFVADVRTAVPTTMPYTDVVTAGQRLCAAIPGARNHAALVALLGKQFGTRQTEVFLTAAERDLCPQTRYGDTRHGDTVVRVPVGVPVPVPVGVAVPVAPVGSRFTVPPGIYQVGYGAYEIPPGNYRAPGPGPGQYDCYYARLHNNDGGSNDIIANDLSTGQTLFTVVPTDGYVKTDGCTFTRY